ncbi:hypothetical protein CRENBAI_025134 [Crenichthys baileyi]|uniref:Uncharacterized protein n=1 Tax=Crenichthys baileyi TaxID=28760 RepID=A0AAV9SG79_9TELE
MQLPALPQRVCVYATACGAEGELNASSFLHRRRAGCGPPHACEPETEWYDGREGGSFFVSLRKEERRGGRCKPDWVEQRIGPAPSTVQTAGARYCTESLADGERWGRFVGGSSAKREGGGGEEEEEEAARVLFRQSLSPVFVSHTLLLAMPSLLVLAGIMEKNGGYGGDLAGSGFGGEGLLVAPDEEEDDSRALRVALGQLSLLGLGEGEDGGGGAPTTGVQDRSNNNNNNHHHNHANSVGDAAILQGKSKLCALYESSSAETKGRGCNITECVPVPSSEHVAEIVGRQGWMPPLLFSNCYLVLFDKEKGVKTIRSRVLRSFLALFERVCAGKGWERAPFPFWANDFHIHAINVSAQTRAVEQESTASFVV